MAKKTKYGKFETALISPEDYDIIYSAAYEECLKDCRDNLMGLVEDIKQNDRDALETLEGYVEGLGQAIGDTGIRQ